MSSYMNLSGEQEERAMEIHKRAIVVDAHCDTIGSWMETPSMPTFGAPTRRAERRSLGKRSEEGAMDIPRMKEGGLDCQVFAVWTAPAFYDAPLKRAVQMIDAFYLEVEKNLDSIAMCMNYEQIMEGVKKGKIAAILSIEGGEPVQGGPGVLRILYRLGVRVLSFTHFPRNLIADGSGELRSKSGLTDIGAQLVEEMNRIGMIIDVSHINEPGFWDIIEMTKSPVIATHSNCKALCDVHRNLSDEQIEALAEKGGVMGMNYYRGFVEMDWNKANLDKLLDHIDHIVELVGPNHVGLGSDFDGGGGLPGLKDVTEIPNITRGLVAREYSDEEIEKILGGNFLNVFKRVLK